MCNMLSVNLIDDIVDKFTSFKPSLYNTVDDRIYHNSNSLRYTDTILKLYIYGNCIIKQILTKAEIVVYLLIILIMARILLITI